MNCTRCPHNKAVSSGQFRNTPFEKTPCSKCELKPDENRAVPFIDDMGGAAPEMPIDDDGLLPIHVLGEFVAGVMRLNSKQRDAVCLRYAGYSYPEIAKKLRISIATSEARVRRAVACWDDLRELLPIVRIIRDEKRGRTGKNRRSVGKVEKRSVGKPA